MSPIRDIVNLAVQTYLEHYSTPEQETLLATDASLTTESAKDSMIEVLNHLQSLVTEEMTRQSTQLKRRRNREHTLIYQLPHEVFVEIMLTATTFTSNITDAFTLMMVSKYWFDAVARCPPYLVTAERGDKTATRNHDNDEGASWTRGSSVRPGPRVGSR